MNIKISKERYELLNDIDVLRERIFSRIGGAMRKGWKEEKIEQLNAMLDQNEKMKKEEKEKEKHGCS